MEIKKWCFYDFEMISKRVILLKVSSEPSGLIVILTGQFSSLINNPDRTELSESLHI